MISMTSAEVPRLFVSFNWCRRGQRGEKVLSEEELGAMEARDFAPEGPHFFKIFGRRLIVRRAFVISLSSIFSFELTFTFGGGMRVETILKLFQSY